MFYASPMATAPATDRLRLLDLLLGDDGPVEHFVRSRRTEKRSWRLIARDLYDTTGEDVTYETLRSWFPDEATR